MEKKDKYTLWTNPVENWTQVFEGVTITVAIEKAVIKQVEKVSDEQIKKRTNPYKTPVTSATLSKTVE